MANENFPRGLRAVGTTHGGVVSTRTYTMTASATCYKGDPIKVVAAGTAEPVITIAGSGSDDVFGVCASYAKHGVSPFNTSLIDGAADNEVTIWDDIKNTIFEVQGNGTTAFVPGEFYSLVDNSTTALAGNTTSLESNHQLDSTSGATTASAAAGAIWQCVGISTQPNPDGTVNTNGVDQVKVQVRCLVDPISA